MPRISQNLQLSCSKFFGHNLFMANKLDDLKLVITIDEIPVLEGKTIEIYIEKPNGKIVCQEEDIIAYNDTIEVNLKNGVLDSVGSHKGQIKVVDSKGRVSTCKFYFYVGDSICDDDAVINQIGIQTIDNLKIKVAELEKKLNQGIEESKEVKVILDKNEINITEDGSETLKVKLNNPSDTTVYFEIENNYTTLSNDSFIFTKDNYNIEQSLLIAGIRDKTKYLDRKTELKIICGSNTTIIPVKIKNVDIVDINKYTNMNIDFKNTKNLTGYTVTTANGSNLDITYNGTGANPYIPVTMLKGTQYRLVADDLIGNFAINFIGDGIIKTISLNDFVNNEYSFDAENNFNRIEFEPTISMTNITLEGFEIYYINESSSGDESDTNYVSDGLILYSDAANYTGATNSFPTIPIQISKDNIYKITGTVTGCNIYLVNDNLLFSHPLSVAIGLDTKFTADNDYTKLEFRPTSNTGTIAVSNLSIVSYTEGDAEVNVDFDLTNLRNIDGYTFTTKAAHSIDTTYKTGNKGLFVSGLSMPSGGVYTIKCSYMSPTMYMTVRPSDWSSQILIRSTDFVNGEYTFTADKDYGIINFGPNTGDGDSIKVTDLYIVNKTTGLVETPISIDLSTITNTTGYTVNTKTATSLNISYDFGDTECTINSYVGEDIKIPGATYANFVNGYFDNNGNLYGYCISDSFKNFIEISIIAKVKVNASSPWKPLVSFNGFRLMQQSNLKFNLITSDNGNPGWTTNVSMDEFTLGKEIEIAYTINKSGVATVYVDGKLSGSTSYDTSLYKFTDTMTLFALTPTDTGRFDGQLKYLMIYNKALTEKEIHQNYKYNNGVTDDYFTNGGSAAGGGIVDTTETDEEFDSGYFTEAAITSFNAENAFYMSPNGNDNNDGKTRNTPLRTIEECKNKINGQSFSEATIYLEDGEYKVDSSFNLYNGRFGKDCAVNFQGIGNKAEFTAADTLDNSKFVSTTINGVGAYAYDLSSIDLNFSIPSDAKNFYPPFLICEGNRMELAGYPKKYGWAQSNEDQPVASGNGFYITARTNADRAALAKITSFTGVILDCFANVPYSNQYEYISGYNSSNYRIQTSSNHGIKAQTYTGGIQWRIKNSKDLLTEAGEYFIDYTNKMLYFIPPANVSISDAKIQLVASSLYNAFYGNRTDVDRYKYVNDIKINFNKVNFSGFKNRIFNGNLSGLTFTKCRFANIGERTFNANNSKNIQFNQCRFKNAAGMTLALNNGGLWEARRALKGCNITVNECVFDNCGFERTGMTYEFAAYLETVGAVINNCRFKHHSGIVIRWQQNDNQIINNKIKEACYISNDAGALYTGRDIFARGNIIKNNYIYDINFYGTLNAKSGIYLDDMASGNTVENNVIDGYRHGIQLGGGRYNFLLNNTIKNSVAPIWADARGLGWMGNQGKVVNAYWARTSDKLNGAWLTTVWTSKYPDIGNIPANITDFRTGSEASLPRGNQIKNNVFKGGTNGVTAAIKNQQYGNVYSGNTY